jgi:hypothetical protein
MLGEAKAGRITAAVGSVNPLRVDDGGALAVQLSGDYSEPALRGRLYFAYCAAQAVSVPATAQVGLCIWNPPTSGVNMVLGKWSLATTSTSATTTGYTLGACYQPTLPTSVTAATAYGSTVLAPATFPVGKCVAYQAATILAAPTVLQIMCHNTAAIATTGVDLMTGDFAGAWIIQPGYAVAVSALGAASVATTLSLLWEERPIGY